MFVFFAFTFTFLLILSLPVAGIVWRNTKESRWHWPLSLLSLLFAPFVIAIMVGNYSLINRYYPSLLDMLLDGNLATTQSLRLPALVLCAPILLLVWYLAKKSQKSNKTT
ncbi:hypothetical protein FO488_18970 [Geobacter sp. FeAm09]|uniref:hypothetical protein n=1 Tax=Geobacter sp. FeAm09 TaxID=2597769 RepID=UPI0011F0679C|nr:hypothetical protein [Geobacter sp. FeAm09]QEM70032.1 hypothetical protein FO488_18970 [Geobacter sp. FeAm09]